MGPGSAGSGAWSSTTAVVYSPSVGLSSTRMCRAARTSPPAAPAGQRWPRARSMNACAGAALRPRRVLAAPSYNGRLARSDIVCMGRDVHSGHALAAPSLGPAWAASPMAPASSQNKRARWRCSGVTVHTRGSPTARPAQAYGLGEGRGRRTSMSRLDARFMTSAGYASRSAASTTGEVPAAVLGSWPPAAACARGRARPSVVHLSILQRAPFQSASIS